MSELLGQQVVVENRGGASDSVGAIEASWKTMGELVAAAKGAPDTISYATSGIGGLPHVSCTLMQQLGDFKLTHVPYRGAGPALQDALSGQIALFMSNALNVSQHIRAGTLRPLGVTTLGEIRHVPGVKSFAQQGFADFEALNWWAVFGRVGTPEPILWRMSEALSRILTIPEARDRIEGLGADVAVGGPERAHRFLTSEVAKWGRVIRDDNITVES